MFNLFSFGQFCSFSVLVNLKLLGTAISLFKVAEDLVCVFGSILRCYCLCPKVIK